MKITWATCAIFVSLLFISGPGAASRDSGRITFHGEIVEGEAPCTFIPQQQDQAVELNPHQATRFSIRVDRCAQETLSNITATFTGRDVPGNNALIAMPGAAAVQLKDASGKIIKMTAVQEPALTLSPQHTLDYSAQLQHTAFHSDTASAITQLMLAYE